MDDSTDSERLRALAERDQLWTSLVPLRPEIDALAAGRSDGSDRERQLVRLLARIVGAEMDFRAGPAGGW